MIVDAECGMPLDLGKWEALWEDGADDHALNPDPRSPPILDPKDQALLLDPAGGPADFGRHHSGANHNHSSGTPPVAAHHVSWLRKTEYISRDSSSPSMRAASTADLTSLNDAVDVSREAQLASIDSSFGAARASDDLNALRHPTKPRLRAVATYEVLPDADVWANAYDLFRFSERPGERGPELDDPRLDCAIMRPMESDGDHFLTYYLTKDDDAAELFKDSRADPRGVDTLEEEEDATEFHFVRDYEVVKVEQEVPNEFLLVFDESEHGAIDTGSASTDTDARRPGAYYKLIERKMLLKKKRTEPIERFRDKWALVRVAHVPPSQEEAEERAEALAEVRDPMYLLQSADAEGEDDIDGDADADGEREVLIPAPLA
jgi:RNA polymerase II-associated factor 1